MQTEASRFVVRGQDEETGRVETVDLLSDRLISSQQIVLASERTRTLNTRSAYAAIRRAHRELQDELIGAAAIDAEAVPGE
ncbi:MAG: hypothetical protein H0U53_06130 [Actinobacteria bacterium]|nr:hypothetical protein [Actinomycetota bacterium]